MQAAHQEPKLMIWLQLSAWSMNRNKDIVHDLVATTDMHHRPVWAHTQRPGKGLQAKQSWKVCTPMGTPFFVRCEFRWLESDDLIGQRPRDVRRSIAVGRFH